MSCPRPDKVLRFNRSAQARRAQQRIFAQTGQWLMVYHCRCQQYHLGKPRKPPAVQAEHPDLPDRYRNHHPLRRAA